MYILFENKNKAEMVEQLPDYPCYFMMLIDNPRKTFQYSFLPMERPLERINSDGVTERLLTGSGYVNIFIKELENFKWRWAAEASTTFKEPEVRTDTPELKRPRVEDNGDAIMHSGAGQAEPSGSNTTTDSSMQTE